MARQAGVVSNEATVQPTGGRIGVSRMSRYRRREAIWFHILTLPWLVGFCVFMVYPIVASAYFSFTSYDGISAPRWIGLANYRYLFTRDTFFWQSLRVTFTYALIAVPLGLAASLTFAVLLNFRIPGMRLLRTIYYMPTVLPQVATAMLWLFLFAPTFGVLDWVLVTVFHVPGPNWLGDPHWALPAFIIMSLWGLGGPMVIFLAALQSVPEELHEAAQLDGANALRRFWSVTIPFISPVLLFNLIIGTIGAMQIFATAFIMTSGGPDFATYFYNLDLYNNAFIYFRLGVAAAQAWILFVIIVALTAIVFKFSSRWVFYGGTR